MKIGYANHPRKNLYSEIDWIGQNGFDFVDLFMEEDCAVARKVDPGKVKETLEKNNLSATGHTAWYLPIGNPSPTIRNSALEELKILFPFFQKIGVKLVTIHSNWVPVMFSADDCMGFQIETLKRIVDLGAQYDISPMFEPVDTPFDSIENTRKILDSVPGLKLHIDIGHTNLSGRQPLRFFEAFKNDVVHFHLHDNNGMADQHLPMGCGTINWNELIPAIKKVYDATITLEIFVTDKHYVLYSKDKLRKLWNES